MRDDKWWPCSTDRYCHEQALGWHISREMIGKLAGMSGTGIYNWPVCKFDRFVFTYMTRTSRWRIPSLLRSPVFAKGETI